VRIEIDAQYAVRRRALDVEEHALLPARSPRVLDLAKAQLGGRVSRGHVAQYAGGEPFDGARPGSDGLRVAGGHGIKHANGLRRPSLDSDLP
jgi:hypothetical protein